MRRFCVFIILAAATIQADEIDLSSCSDPIGRHDDRVVNFSRDRPCVIEQLDRRRISTIPESLVQHEMNAAQLEFLLRTGRRLWSRDRIQFDGLDSLMASILKHQPEDPQWLWWKAFNEWLNRLRPDDYEQQYQWLRNFIQEIIPTRHTIEFFFYVLISLLVMLSLWLVFRELYRSGALVSVFGVQPRSADTKLSRPQANGEEPRVVPIETMAPEVQVRVLLARIVQSLIQRRKIPNDASLTFREIAAAVKGTDRTESLRFDSLVRQAEPFLYGKRSIDRQTLEKYWMDAEELLGRPIR